MSWLDDPPRPEERATADRLRPRVDTLVRRHRQRRRAAGAAATIAVLALLVVLPFTLTGGSAPSRALRPARPTPTTVPATTTTTTAGSSLLAPGSPVSASRVRPVSFVSPTVGFGLFHYDGRGDSLAQQLVTSDDGGVTWRVAATTPLPGWATTIAFTDPSDGYAWGYGGLLVTHDGGVRWDVSHIAVSSDDETVSVIGDNVWALSASDGLETSRDGGGSWQKPAQPPLSTLGSLSRVNDNVAFVLGCDPTSHSLVQDLTRTEDGGATWQSFGPLPGGCTAVADADLVALSANDLWLVEFGQPQTGFSSKWVYRSDDGGAHWALMASQVLGDPGQDTGEIPASGDSGPLSVLGADPGRAWLAEDRGGLLVTTDGGHIWTAAYDDPNAGAEGPPSVAFFGIGDGWSATGNGLWRTTDGAQWTQIATSPRPTSHPPTTGAPTSVATTQPVSSPPQTSTPPSGCRSGSVSVTVSHTNPSSGLCLQLGATLTVVFDKSSGGIGSPGRWTVPPVMVSQSGVLSLVSTTSAGQRLTAVFRTVGTGAVNVSASYDEECSAGDETPCTIPPESTIDLPVTVVGP